MRLQGCVLLWAVVNIHQQLGSRTGTLTVTAWRRLPSAVSMLSGSPHPPLQCHTVSVSPLSLPAEQYVDPQLRRCSLGALVRTLPSGSSEHLPWHPECCVA